MLKRYEREDRHSSGGESGATEFEALEIWARCDEQLRDADARSGVSQSAQIGEACPDAEGRVLEPERFRELMRSSSRRGRRRKVFVTSAGRMMLALSEKRFVRDSERMLRKNKKRVMSYVMTLGFACIV